MTDSSAILGLDSHSRYSPVHGSKLYRNGLRGQSTATSSMSTKAMCLSNDCSGTQVSMNKAFELAVTSQGEQAFGALQSRPEFGA